MAQKQYRLWTPIANALEAYRRRLLADPKAVYEHVWRLIHIQESLIVTLGAALASRLLELWTRTVPACNEANRLRREVTGLAVPGVAELDTDLARGDACLDGYIKPWIDLLKDFATDAEKTDCPFCKATAGYLTEKPSQPLAFLESWKRVAEVPQVFVGELSRVDRFAAINSLRNKIAHVPVPHKIFGDLHWGLRQELLALLTPEYKPQTDVATRDYETTKWHEPLKGRFIAGSCVLTGSAINQELTQRSQTGEIYAEVASLGNGSDDGWCISPFVRVDDELKVSLLFSLNDIRTDPASSQFGGEFHRFAAEIQPVQKETVLRAMVANWIPVAPPKEPTLPPPPPISGPPAEPAPVPARTAEVDQPTPTMSPRELRRIGEDAFRVRDYERAVQAFDLLAEQEDDIEYNDVARSKHGGALWRLAEQLSIPDNERERLIRRAIELLDQASAHRDPRYQARALYEQSKALWHLWRMVGEPAPLNQALEVAGEAARLQNEPAFVNWYERVADDLDRLRPQVQRATSNEDDQIPG